MERKPTDWRHVTENLRPVNAHPVERRMREGVDVVPAELLSEEVFHAGSPDELRKGTR